ncbi:MAG: AAA family ATPase [Clostridia bacterium]|nr:AAA family ATPase [Clostridia bacterium]
MINIITAVGNPNLNEELKKYEEFNILGNDIIYFDGIIELLENNKKIDYLILGEYFNNRNIEELIDKIKEASNKIKIIVIINKRDKLIENNLFKKGILEIFYENENIDNIINYLKSKNIEYLNIELREEINNLRNIILEKNNKKEKISNKNIIIGITGARGIGKTTSCIMIGKSLNKNNKILIVDFDLINSHIEKIFNKKIENIDKKELDINKCIFNVDKNIDILIGLNILFFNKKTDFFNFKDIIKYLKNKYDYILVDTYTENNFEKNKFIYNYFDSIFLLSGTNKIELLKTEKIINTIKKEWKINNNKINLILYRANIIDFFKLVIKKKRNIFGINIIRNNKKFFFYKKRIN